MIASILLATLTSLSFDAGHLRFSVPSHMRVLQHKVNFETDGYVVLENGSSLPLLRIIDGGGAYDLKGYTKMCLNGRKGWETHDARSGTVVVGEPGFNAVAAEYSNLSIDQLKAARSIIASIRIDFGPKC